MRTLVSA